MRHSVREVLKALVAAGLLAAIVFAGYLASAQLARTADTDRMRGNVQRAFADGLLVTSDQPTQSTLVGMHTWNDCLILHQAMLPPGDVSAVALISPPIVRVDRGTGQTLCSRLRDFASTGAAPETEGRYYHYVHGHTVAARLALPRMSLETYRTLLQGGLHLFFWLSVISPLGLALFLRGGHLPGVVALPIIGGTFLAFFSLEYFGQSLSHGPSDMVVAIFLFGCSIFASAKRLSLFTFACLAAAFGALTMVFEFMTGGIPIGCAMVVGLAPLVIKEDTEPSRADTLLKLGAPLAAFLFAAASLYVMKMGLTAWWFGSESLLSGAAKLNERVAGDLGEIARRGESTFAVAIQQLRWGLKNSVGGTKYVGVLILATSVLLAAAALKRSWPRLGRAGREAGLALIGSNLLIVGWFGLFSQHTAVHAWFMGRILTWTTASAVALTALAVFYIGSRPAGEEVSGAPAA